jgi:hypothetical protein
LKLSLSSLLHAFGVVCALSPLLNLFLPLTIVLNFSLSP